jgi:hypothetical protein
MALSSAEPKVNVQDFRARTLQPTIALFVGTMAPTERILPCPVQSIRITSMATQPKKPVLSTVLHQTS